MDAEASTDCERTLQDKLDKIGNRLASGSDCPPPVRAVSIPKRTGGTRLRGMPTVGDRSAQRVAKEYLEPRVAPHVHPAS